MLSNTASDVSLQVNGSMTLSLGVGGGTAVTINDTQALSCPGRIECDILRAATLVACQSDIEANAPAIETQTINAFNASIANLQVTNLQTANVNVGNEDNAGTLSVYGALGVVGSMTAGSLTTPSLAVNGNGTVTGTLNRDAGSVTTAGQVTAGSISLSGGGIMGGSLSAANFGTAGLRVIAAGSATINGPGHLQQQPSPAAAP